MMCTRRETKGIFCATEIERDDEPKFEAFCLSGLVFSVSDMSIVRPVLVVISPERAKLAITVLYGK